MKNKLSQISENAQIGQNVKIGRFCIVEEDVLIGDNSVVGDHAIILSGTKIGKNTKIGPFSVIEKNVTIGNNCSFTAYCEIRENCILGQEVSMGSRGTLSAGTIVEDQVIMKYSFVATDIPVLEKKDLKKACILKQRSRFGANVTILPSVTIGENSEIGACSQVRNNVPDNEIWYGNPAKFYKKL
ncbi:MAG: DapH/DapD/GlmU-related protein [Desulfobacterales bacterium]